MIQNPNLYSSTKTLTEAMWVLSREVLSDDGVANAAIAEAANRLAEQEEEIKRLREILQTRNLCQLCGGNIETIQYDDKIKIYFCNECRQH